eukprot:TRINITY_DN737_c0_g1_i3.p1 TRINITY_DN737_c0_g1~~TRINITY_DN737_c0_g1_i3.p1  ORF type:complete len:332 (-),score=3.28 TRINITY_DN737_c0_g1_i3:181-1176(-)
MLFSWTRIQGISKQMYSRRVHKPHLLQIPLKHLKQMLAEPDLDSLKPIRDHPSNEHVEKIISILWPEIMKSLNVELGKYAVLSYRIYPMEPRRIGGTLYEIVVNVENYGKILVRAFNPVLPSTEPSLIGVIRLPGMTKNEKFPLLNEFGFPQPIDANVAKLVKCHSEEIKKQMPITYRYFAPISYCTQVVEGTNYSIKIQADEDKYICAVIYVPLPYTGGHSMLVNVGEWKEPLITGAYGDYRKMDKEVEDMVVSLRPGIEEACGLNHVIFVPVSYRTQVVAGINYMVRIATEGITNLSVTIFKELPCHGGKYYLTGVTICQFLSSHFDMH